MFVQYWSIFIFSVSRFWNVLTAKYMSIFVRRTRRQSGIDKNITGFHLPFIRFTFHFYIRSCGACTIKKTVNRLSWNKRKNARYQNYFMWKMNNLKQNNSKKPIEFSLCTSTTTQFVTDRSCVLLKSCVLKNSVRRCVELFCYVIWVKLSKTVIWNSY